MTYKVTGAKDFGKMVRYYEAIVKADSPEEAKRQYHLSTDIRSEVVKVEKVEDES